MPEREYSLSDILDMECIKDLGEVAAEVRDSIENDFDNPVDPAELWKQMIILQAAVGYITYKVLGRDAAQSLLDVANFGLEVLEEHDNEQYPTVR